MSAPALSSAPPPGDEQEKPDAAPADALSQRDRAYAALRHLLILQKLGEGERLREPEWAARLGVNRMALREAFARLEAEGLIERGPRTGYFVPRLSDADIHDILEVRTMLECAAVGRFCQAQPHDPDRLAPLRTACDQLQSLIEQGYLLGVSEADRRFHEALIGLAGNRRLETVYQRAPLPMIHGRIVGSSVWADECRRTLADHRAIIAALEQADAPRAQALLRDHLSERYLMPLRG